MAALRRQLQQATRELEAVRHEYGMPPPVTTTAGKAGGGGCGGVGTAAEGNDGEGGVAEEGQQQQREEREVARCEAAVAAGRQELQQLLAERSRLGDCQVGGWGSLTGHTSVLIA